MPSRAYLGDSMSASLPASLVFLELLADRNLRPGALLLRWPGGTPVLAELAELAAQSDFQLLCGQIPCLVETGVGKAASAAPDPGALQAMAHGIAQAGCMPLDPAQVVRFDQSVGSLPPAAAWVAGDWYLHTAPARANDSQAASRALALQLVQLVAEDADTRDIEDVLRRDAALSYHLLRVVNSLGAGGSREITSFGQAILMLGRQQLRRWLNLMLFSARAGDQRSAMLAARVAVRARCMELVARASGMDRATQELAFMAGMFSLLGVLFGMPLEQVLQPLKIGDALRDAVLAQAGPLGELLALALCAERGDAPALAAALSRLQVDAGDYVQLLLQAHHWMLSLTRESGHA